MKKYVIKKAGSDKYLVNAWPRKDPEAYTGAWVFDWGGLSKAKVFDSPDELHEFLGKVAREPAETAVLGMRFDIEEIDWTPPATPDSAAKQCINCKYFRQTGVHSGNCTWHYENPTPLWLQRELPVRLMQKRDGHFCSVFKEGGEA